MQLISDGEQTLKSCYFHLTALPQKVRDRNKNLCSDGYSCLEVMHKAHGKWTWENLFSRRCHPNLEPVRRAGWVSLST